MPLYDGYGVQSTGSSGWNKIKINPTALALWEGELEDLAETLRLRLNIPDEQWNYVKDEGSIEAVQSLLILINGVVDKLEKSGCMFCKENR